MSYFIQHISNTLIWFILSLCGVCKFSWLVLFIDGIAELLIYACISGNEKDSYVADSIASGAMGIVAFAFYKYFCGLTISPWFILLSPIWFLAAFFVPGGFTITLLVLSHFGLLTYATWVLIVAIVLVCKTPYHSPLSFL